MLKRADESKRWLVENKFSNVSREPPRAGLEVHLEKAKSLTFNEGARLGWLNTLSALHMLEA